jgi:catechol 2,3-dioxygenase-like lactoylglutathione lyase family enzyme
MMDFKLEVVVVPVTDVDRAKSFYVDRLGFRLDADTQPSETMRVVHMTPPGSGCSVVVGPVVVEPDFAFGSGARFQLVVQDIEAARRELLDRGVEVSEVEVIAPMDGGSFCYLSDPDGNAWAIQEVRERIGAPLT